jgi:hypothetical protein
VSFSVVLKHNNAMATERESVRPPSPPSSLPSFARPSLKPRQKNLNLVATFFLPLSFLAGIFGMNFYENGE